MNTGASRNVGIAGAGNMGGAMARRLLDQGYAVHIYDIDSNKVNELAAVGAFSCKNALAVAQAAMLLIVCVVDAAQCEDVLFGAGGAAASLTNGHTVMLCPTLAPESVESLAERLGRQGVTVIDAPMSGGPGRARDGSMSLMLAAPDEVLAAHAALLQTLSSQRFHVSQRPGDGARTKLVNNLVAGINLVAAAEGLALAQRMGLDLATTLAVMENSSAQSWVGSDRMRRVLANDGQGDYAPRAHMTLLAKDTRLAVAAAASAGFEGPLGASVSAVFKQACDSGLSGEDDAAVFKLLAGKGI